MCQYNMQEHECINALRISTLLILIHLSMHDVNTNRDCNESSILLILTPTPDSALNLASLWKFTVTKSRYVRLHTLEIKLPAEHPVKPNMSILLPGNMIIQQVKKTISKFYLKSTNSNKST